MTDKGYRPDDLINLPGIVRVASGWLRKRTGSQSDDPDPNCVSKAWENNKDFWMKTLVDQEYFIRDKIKKGTNKEIIYSACSLSFSLNY
jgi:hypothetical protein